MSIDTLAHELIEARRASKQLLGAGEIDAWLEAMPAEFRAAEGLRSHLLNHPFVVTDDPTVKELLAGIDLSEFDDADKTGMQLLWGSIGPAEYATNLALVDILIAPFQIPSDLQLFLREARECYAIGHHAAVQSLSRTILEVAVNDVAVRSGKMSKEVIELDMFKKYPPWRRIKLVSGDLFEQINDHYRDLCKVVHGLAISASCGALGSLTKTIGFVQLLYERNKDQIRAIQDGR